MSIYVSEKGEEVEVGTMNSFRLVNGLTKMAGKLAVEGNDPTSQEAKNVQVLSAEIISRLAPPPAE